MKADILWILSYYISQNITRRLADYCLYLPICLRLIGKNHILIGKYRYKLLQNGDKYIYKYDKLIFKLLRCGNRDLYRLFHPINIMFIYNINKNICALIDIHYKDYSIFKRGLDDSDVNHTIYLFHRGNPNIKITIYNISQFKIKIYYNDKIYFRFTNNNIVNNCHTINRRGYWYNNNRKLINIRRGVINIWHHSGVKLCAIRYSNSGYYCSPLRLYLPNGQQFAEF